MARAKRSVGMVHRIDTINRELAVFVNGELLIFDVPVACPIVLHGEPVKLRMVQPLDRVIITHADRGGLRVAQRIEVQPEAIAGRTADDRSPIRRAPGSLGTGTE